MKKVWDIIEKPIITEKAMSIGDINKYIFVVTNKANKNIIKKAVEKIFSVNVEKVNIINVEGKKKRFRNFWGKRIDYKKAIVTLQDGYSINLGIGGK